MRGRGGSGIVSATTLAPISRARSPAASRCSTNAPFIALTVSRFQLSGRRAAADMRAITSRCRSVKSRVGMNSSDVPGCSPVTRHSASSSSAVACRDGTGSPSASLWVSAHDDEKPRPPAASDSRSRFDIAARSSSVAASPTLRSPITTRRSAQWPTMKPAFTESVLSKWSKYSAVVVQSHGTPAASASSGMPSTRASIFMRYSASRGTSGAIVKPQLPPSTVVTPCSGDGLSVGSQNTCAS